MYRRFLIGVLACISWYNAQSQWCTVARDSAGQITTTCLGPGDKLLSEQHFLGSEYLTFPIWQPGTMLLGSTGREIHGTICYNIYAGQVFFRLGDEAPQQVFPDAFTINDERYDKHLINGRAVYCQIRYAGKTKLLAVVSCRLEPISASFDKTGGTSLYKARYKPRTTYYLQSGNGPVKPVALNGTALRTALVEHPDAVAALVPDDTLSWANTVKILSAYDSLLTATLRCPLDADPDFRPMLYEHIRYPAQLWNKGLYSRVYIGFDIDAQGQINHIMPLSPGNVGYGFIAAVTGALKKLPAFSAAYAGRYVLPVAFTYTNLAVSQSRSVPQNHLPAERIDNRTMLTELQVPMVINKPALAGESAQEVWGWYK
ncbi:hypothetical protein [Arsenicibacter rosenii]|uniref:TonB C-terminal domain-containing protein n=1 Tax=Arsenicibacter rosenii TaxID=1750698 RepID=A0A1S2VK38_9BACT|nr:hypothetical protein [Arsenicibacter rosenii]OIN59093.1 hypothetical protein BLX24_12880 [Arsenicibacter rosenii]